MFRRRDSHLGFRTELETLVGHAKRWTREAESTARRHLSGGTLVLYDVTSSYMEGRRCPLAQFGYNRDGKKGKLQIVYGLLCAPDGCPVAIEVFEGSTGDPSTLGAQVAKLKQRFGLGHVVLVGDRGMITEARITEDIKPAGLDWITALRAPAIRGLLGGGAFQMSLFDDRDMAAITSPDFPGERLIVCRNHALAAERARKREDLLQATERDLARIAAAVRRKRQPLTGKAEIGMAVGAVIGKHNMAKHFALEIADTTFAFARKTAAIAAEAALDGLYAVRTSLPATALDDSATVKSYKSLALVEHAIRSMKTVDLHVRPVYHWLPDRVRAHVFLCMLGYYLEWHMRQRLAPMLYDDDDKQAAEALRVSVVAKAQRSPAAVAKHPAPVAAPRGSHRGSFWRLTCPSQSWRRPGLVRSPNSATCSPEHSPAEAVSDEMLAVPLAVVASCHEQPVPIFQQLAGGHSSGGDDVREIPAVAPQRRRSPGRAWDRHQPRNRPVLVEPVWPDVRRRDPQETSGAHARLSSVALSHGPHWPSGTNLRRNRSLGLGELCC